MPEVATLKDNIQITRNWDISHPHLGDDNFRECEEFKNEFCDFLLRYLVNFETFRRFYSDTYAEHQLERVEENHNALLLESDKLKLCVASGTLATWFSDERRRLITAFRGHVLNIHAEFMPLMAWFELQHLKDDRDYLPSIKSESSTLMGLLEHRADRADRILKQLKDELQIVTNHKAAANFKERADEHYQWQKVWLTATVSLAVILLIILGWSLSGLERSLEDGKLVPVIVSKILTITLFGLFFKICLTKYTLERNLYVIYRHRNNVLDFYRTADAALDSMADRDAKDQLRLKIAELIYSDPETGMVKSAGEFNFAPVMSAIEKAGS